MLAVGEGKWGPERVGGFCSDSKCALALIFIRVSAHIRRRRCILGGSHQPFLFFPSLTLPLSLISSTLSPPILFYLSLIDLIPPKRATTVPDLKLIFYLLSLYPFVLNQSQQSDMFHFYVFFTHT